MGTVASRLPIVMAVADELMRAGLDSDNTAVAEVALLMVLDTSEKDAPATFDTALLMVNRLGLYCNVKLPEVTFKPLLSAMGMPLPGMLLATLIVASAIDAPASGDESNWLVACANALWNVTKILVPELTSLVTMTTELGVLLALALTPIWVASAPLVRA